MKVKLLPVMLFAIAAAVVARSLTSGAASQAVPADIRSIFNKPAYQNATWGIRVMDGSRVLMDYNPTHKFWIGSVRKVFSVGQLLDAVGPNHTFDTPVYRDGTVTNGVLHGNLIVVASGDLTMGGRTNPDGSIAVSSWDHNEADSLGNAILTKPNPLAGYARLARQIKESGIDRVDGEVVVDDRLFQPYFFRDQFNVRPIFVNDDVVDLTIVPGGQPGALAAVTHRPVSSALAIDNDLHNGAPSSPNTMKIDPELPACIGKPGCSSTISGSLPTNFVPPLTGMRQHVQTVRIVQPANYARTVLVEQLTEAGVRVDAPAIEDNPARLLPAKNAYKAGDRVALFKGMTYANDAKLILKVSYNIGADTSLLLFGTTKGVDSMDGALSAEQKNLASKFGISEDDYHFVDGSGGGDTNATNSAVTHMLQQLSKRSFFKPFYDALPILAVDGSLATVTDFKKDPTLRGAAGTVHAKTGTWVAGGPDGKPLLKGQALGGYVTTKSGKRLVFQMVVNNVPMSGINDVIAVFQDQGRIAAMLWRDY